MFIKLRTLLATFLPSLTLQVLDDLEANCAGLICDYSFIAWKEKIEILEANNELRNIIADGYTADIATAAINKLAWSEKLGVLAQDQANQCPGSKIWTSTEKNGQCEYASAKRVRKYLRLHKNFSSFVDENRMMDFEEDVSDRTKKKLRRASAYSVGCGYVLRHHKDKLIDHFVCLYCYVNNKHDYISFNGNRSCQQDCLHENFTCDRIYNRLCSYKSKDGNIDSRHKSNPLCPKVTLLTGSVLFWNFLSNNVICMLAAIFILTSIIFSVVLAVYFSIKNYDHWKKYFVGKGVVDGEQEVPPSAESTARLESTSTPPPLTKVAQAPTIVPLEDPKPSATSLLADKSACRLPLQCLPPVRDSQSFPPQKLQKREESRKNLAEYSQNDKKSRTAAAGTATSGHKVDETVSTSSKKRIVARKMVTEGASKMSGGVGGGKNGKNRVSDPIYGQCDNVGTNKRSVQQKRRRQQLGGGSRRS